MPIHFGEGSRMRITYTTARFEVMSHRSISQSTLHMLWRRLLRHPEPHRSIGQLTLKRLFYVKTFSKNFIKRIGIWETVASGMGAIGRGTVDWPIVRWILAYKMFYVKNFTLHIFYANIHRTIGFLFARALRFPSRRRPFARYRYVS